MIAVVVVVVALGLGQVATSSKQQKHDMSNIIAVVGSKKSKSCGGNSCM